MHEINNPLATIAACAESLEKRIKEGAFGDSPDAEDLREYLGLIRDEAFRCKSITNGLLDFSRLRAGQRMPVDITEVIKGTARLVTHQQRGDNIQIVIEAAAGLPSVSGDVGQLQQAVVALATNAIDAMPEGGTLTLRAIRADARILVQVIDTGIGIEPENMTKIFDPFFTTKDVGRGTGWGWPSVMVFYLIMVAVWTCGPPWAPAPRLLLHCQSRMNQLTFPSAEHKS